MISSYKRIIQEFEKLSERHLMINSFGHGPLPDMNKLDNLYPKLWLAPLSVSFGDSVISIQFNMLIVDILIDGKNNELDIMSDTIKIADDVFTEINTGYISQYGMDMQITNGNPLFNITKDGVDGWMYNVTIDIPKEMYNCAYVE